MSDLDAGCPKLPKVRAVAKKYLTIEVIDSHTGGEPTRVVIAGGPKLRGATLAERRDCFRAEFDPFRSAIVNEPRGSDTLVGAMLCEPTDPGCVAGVVFFNNVGFLNMCGHGAIGVAETLHHLGRIQAGEHRLDTPVGSVAFWLNDDGSVTVKNVPSFRTQKGLRVEVPGYGAVTGDVAWGGNWFFLVEDHGQELSLDNLEALTDFTWQLRQELARRGITGNDNQEIDHIEFFGPPSDPGYHSKSFVLCPGKAYDRSPCGTGTSAKLACLFADGKLKEGEIWRQESIIGSVFAGRVQKEGELLFPYITGRAHIMAEAKLLLDESDLFCFGIRE
jgi:4-hydroxyproline epimerase